MVKEWSSLSVICALLAGVAAMGMFYSADFIHDYSGYHHGGDENLMNNTMASGVWLHVHQKHSLAEWTMILFCIDTFCFLNATVLSTFFVACAGRNPSATLDDLYTQLGCVQYCLSNNLA